MAITIWKGHLTFGLVSIPVKLIRAARAEKIRMHNLQRQTGTRVRQVFVPRENPPLGPPPGVMRPSLVAPIKPEKTPDPAPERVLKKEEVEKEESVETPAVDREVPKSDLVRGFEYEKDKYVRFEPAELEKIAPQKSSDMQIVEFVKFADIDPVYLESSYYVVADSGGTRPYALLFAALRKTAYAAIAEFVMHRRDQVLVMRPGRHGLIAHTLFHEDEVKGENEFHADQGLVTPKELELAVKLVDALAAKFEPGKFKDKYRERLQSAISEKVETGAVTEAPTPAASTQVVDIMAALKESLAKAKKPAASETKTPRKPKKAGVK